MNIIGLSRGRFRFRFGFELGLIKDIVNQKEY